MKYTWCIYCYIKDKIINKLISFSLIFKKKSVSQPFISIHLIASNNNDGNAQLFNTNPLDGRFGLTRNDLTAFLTFVFGVFEDENVFLLIFFFNFISNTSS